MDNKLQTITANRTARGITQLLVRSLVVGLTLTCGYVHGMQVAPDKVELGSKERANNLTQAKAAARSLRVATDIRDQVQLYASSSKTAEQLKLYIGMQMAPMYEYACQHYGQYGGGYPQTSAYPQYGSYQMPSYQRSHSMGQVVLQVSDEDQDYKDALTAIGVVNQGAASDAVALDVGDSFDASVIARAGAVKSSQKSAIMNTLGFFGSYESDIDTYAPNKVIDAFNAGPFGAMCGSWAEIANLGTTFTKGYTDPYDTVYPLEVNGGGVVSLTTLYPFASELTTDEKAALVAAQY